MLSKMSKTLIVVIIAMAMVVPLASGVFAAPGGPVPPGQLDPRTIPKFVNQLTGSPPVYEYIEQLNPNTGVMERYYEVDVTAFSQQILPAPLPMTPVWGYGGQAKDALTGESLGYVRNAPGPSFEAIRDVPINVKWVNSLTGEHMFPVDPTLHWADPNGMDHTSIMPPFEPYPPGYPMAQAPVPIVPHLHGAEVRSTSDGVPEAWFTWNGLQGMDYWTEEPTDANAAVYRYPNSQLPTTLWYHDHALGITRLNVMSGLAGFYFLRDPADPIAPLLPSGEYEVPIVIQDRTFNADGSFWFPTVGLDPSVHPYWQPEFFGNTIMVNGLVWPNMDVDQGQYRLRLLDGSNARFYDLSFKTTNLPVNGKVPFTVIGTDGGYLRSAAITNTLTIAPGERYDILIDFSGLPAGTTVLMENKGKTPFPNGAQPDPKTTGQIMQFTVLPVPGHVAQVLPAMLNPTLSAAFPSLPTTLNQRILTLTEVMGPLGPIEILLNGQKWMDPITETPTEGTVEEWVIVNPTMDTHPIHLHLAQFQLVSRQSIDVRKYDADWMALNGMPPVMGTPIELPIGPYLKGKPSMANPWEQGWKDTVQMNPGEVTIIRVRFSPQDGSSETYSFDPSYGPGYVWHCHILDHEDNEMMRPYRVIAAPGAIRP